MATVRDKDASSDVIDVTRDTAGELECYMARECKTKSVPSCKVGVAFLSSQFMPTIMQNICKKCAILVTTNHHIKTKYGTLYNIQSHDILNSSLFSNLTGMNNLLSFWAVSFILSVPNVTFQKPNGNCSWCTLSIGIYIRLCCT